jgi:hypothetical protein
LNLISYLFSQTKKLIHSFNTKEFSLLLSKKIIETKLQVEV